MLLQAPVFERKSVVDQSASKRKEAAPKNKMAPNLGSGDYCPQVASVASTGSK